MMPGPYNNNYQILQTPGYVVILHEMIHDARIIPLDGRPHIGQNVRQWFGDSRGRWEGDTLVVDTTNFTDKANYQRIDGRPAPHRALHAHQRRHRQIRVHDRRPDDVHEASGRRRFRWRSTDEQIYEYACHEGNYGMVNLLSGARVQEKAAGEGK